MHYWVDSEFQDTGKEIHLISIGIVASDGRELYGQSTEFDLRNGSDWVWQNVYPHLEVCPYRRSELDRALCCKHKLGQCATIPGDEPYNRCPWRTREQLKQDILAFLDVEKYGKPELRGWCCGYDFTVLCQLWGTMMDVPRFIPHYMRDLQQVLDEYEITDDMLPPMEEGQEHHALRDAKYIQKIWSMLEEDEAEVWTIDRVEDLARRWSVLLAEQGKPPTVLTTTQTKWQLRKMGLLKEG